MGLFSILGKDCRQHWPIAAAMLAFVFIVHAVYARIAALGPMLSDLQLVSMFAQVPLLVVALVVSQRLVTAEYYGGTQRFIEVLPIRRRTMVASKFLLGWLFLAGLAFALFGMLLQSAASKEFIDGRFVFIMATRLLVFVSTVWAVAFAVGFLGKLRWPLLAILVATVWALDTYTAFEQQRFGPWELVSSQTFPMERTELPVAALVQSAWIVVIAATIGFALGMLRDGSWAEALAKPMSQRDKTFLAVLVLAAGSMFMGLDTEPEPAPYRFGTNAVLRSESGLVEVAYHEEKFRADGAALVDYLDDRVVSLKDAVGWDKPDFKARVTLSPTIDPEDSQPLRSDADEGVVIAANFERGERYVETNLGALVVHQMLLAQTNGRAIVEPRHWLLDGLSQSWAEHGADKVPRLGESVEPAIVQALYAESRFPLTAAMLRDWDSSIEQLGDLTIMAVAYSGWRVLRERHGIDALKAVARIENGRPVHGDLRDWLWDVRHAPEESIAIATDETWQAFLDAWKASLERLKALPAYRQALAAVPDAHADISAAFTPMGERMLEFVLHMDPAPTSETFCTYMHAPIAPYSQVLGSDAVYKERRLWTPGTAQARHRIVGRYGSGEYIFAAIECRLPGLPSPIRVAVERLTMP